MNGEPPQPWQVGLELAAALLFLSWLVAVGFRLHTPGVYEMALGFPFFAGAGAGSIIALVRQFLYEPWRQRQ